MNLARSLSPLLDITNRPVDIANRPSVIQFGFRTADQLDPGDISVNRDWIERPYYRVRLANLNCAGNVKFGHTSGEYDLQFKLETVPTEYYITVVRSIFEEIFLICNNNKCTPKSNEKYLRLVFKSDSLPSKTINFKRVELQNPQASVDLLLDYIESLLQSNQELLVDRTLTVQFFTYTPIRERTRGITRGIRV